MNRIAWPEVALGEVLSLSVDAVQATPDAEFKIAGVFSFGRGLFAREPLSGADTTYKHFHRLHHNDYVISQPKAWEGAIARVTAEFEGWFLSPVFPTFRANADRLDIRYLEWFGKQSCVWDRLRNVARGMGARRDSVHPDKFLSLSIPLPPLEEQQRIVRRIDVLTDKLCEAHTVRIRSALETDRLARTGIQSILQSAQGETVRLATICSEIIDCLHSNPIYSDSGVPTLRSPDVGWGKLFLESAKKTGTEEYERRTRRGTLHPGDIVVVREGGGTGKAGMIEDGQQASLGQRVMQLRPETSKVIPRFLLYQWLSPMIQQEQIAPRMKGSASPHLNIGAIRQFSFLLPTIPEQVRVVSEVEKFLAGVDTVREAQAHTDKAMSALSPAILDRAFRGAL